jgi:hypothetical protein
MWVTYYNPYSNKAIGVLWSFGILVSTRDAISINK